MGLVCLLSDAGPGPTVGSKESKCEYEEDPSLSVNFLYTQPQDHDDCTTHSSIAYSELEHILVRALSVYYRKGWNQASTDIIDNQRE